MKKLICIALAFAVALSLAACGGKEKQAVATDGSTSMQKVILALGEAFMEDTGANFTYNATGSGPGIKAVKDGTCDIGLSSRYLRDSEKAQGLQETVLAIDGIAIIVHAGNPVADLTLEQIAAIFKGELTNWSQLGGKDGQIVLIGREESSGTRDGFESVTGTVDACLYRQELTSNGAVLTAVAENPNAIGYVSLSSVKDSVKAVSVNGVAPSEATVKDGSYAVQRPFVLVTKQGEKLSKTAQAFFDFATSPAANEIISAAGVVPVN
ncbi:MAG: phosphate ABC transporter substrate-binding protein [Oscillospiraceae bacterium]|nr:phosphate ABC transporter substrate-binding protein [Oscillospiraceae bacterium]